MRAQNSQAPRTLRLQRETLRVLTADDLARIGGGTFIQNPLPAETGACFIMRDSVIVPTSRR